MTERAAHISTFLNKIGWANADRTKVAGDASQRRYDRLQRSSGATAILMDAPPTAGEDVRPFIQIAAHLRSIGLSAPEILASDVSNGLLLIEDFGDALFAELITQDPSLEHSLYAAAADVLVQVQSGAKPTLAVCDGPWLVEMLDPLFEWYAPDVDQEDLARFNAVFAPIAYQVASQNGVMILRDYHAQNLLLLPDRTGTARVGLLDFQDAMLGHSAYDLVSILQDARRDVSTRIEREILTYFIDQTGQDETTFRSAYAVLGLQRNLRILGVFARLGLRDGKADYIDLIPRVWRYVTRNLQHPELAPLVDPLKSCLPAPTPAFLKKLKSQCPPPSFPH